MQLLDSLKLSGHQAIRQAYKQPGAPKDIHESDQPQRHWSDKSLSNFLKSLYDFISWKTETCYTPSIFKVGAELLGLSVCVVYNTLDD